jgi:hypothetical protein
VAKCDNRGERSESVIPFPHQSTTTRLTLARFESFRIRPRWNTYCANALPSDTPISAASSTCERSTPRTFRLGPYYVQFGRHTAKQRTITPEDDLRPADVKHRRLSVPWELSELSSESSPSELPSGSCTSELSSGSRASELPDHGSLNSKLSIISCNKLRQELPTNYGGTLRALVDPASTFRVAFERNALHELEGSSPMSLNSQNSFMDSVGFFHFHQRRESSSCGMVHQAFAPVPASASLPRLQIDEPLNGLPSLISADSSHTPSPVSPVTPSLGTTHHAEVVQHANVSPISVTTLSYQPVPPPLQQPGINEFVPYSSQEAPYCPIPQSPFGPAEAKPFSYAKPILGFWEHDDHHASNFTPDLKISMHDVAQYQHIDPVSTVPEFSGWRSEVRQNEMVFHMTGTERTGRASSWHRNLRSANVPVEYHETYPNLNPFDATAQTDEIDHSASCFHVPTIAAQSNSEASVRNQEFTNVRLAPQYPRERCNICGGEFTGK